MTDRYELPTVIHRTPEQLRTQRARLIASTGLTEDVLRERAEAWQLYPEHLTAWNTVEGIDYLLGGDADPEPDDSDDTPACVIPANA
ncbi:hypothetical protein ACFU76_07945 [Streptomyces sp. NPDC057539]|uniref:hypothetical protein n=1 Tax=Streptomyces sp. NPDC057539 TaxID=3346159 RepID=UPI0036C3BF5F